MASDRNPTVREVIFWLMGLPLDAEVYGYEGEGGAYIVVAAKEPRQEWSLKTNG